MEISNEIKAKVFAQYLGQMCRHFPDSIKDRKLIAVGGIDDKEYYSLRLGANGGHVGTAYIENNNWKLILKPLSKISDEDAIEVAKILGFEILNAEYKVHRTGKRVFIVEKGNDEFATEGCKLFFKNESLDGFIVSNNLPHDFSPDSVCLAFQFLQSRGYDLPQYLLDGKTLFESNLAIYE